MADSSTEGVPRTPEGPTPADVLDEMSQCEPYTAGEIQDLFPDVSRWTIQRRLDSLLEDGKIAKKKHSENRVSYWKPVD